MRVQVNSDLCDGCGFCVASCPQGVFELRDDISCAVHEEDCLACRLCEVSCENGAITIEEF